MSEEAVANEILQQLKDIARDGHAMLELDQYDCQVWLKRDERLLLKAQAEPLQARIAELERALEEFEARKVREGS